MERNRKRNVIRRNGENDDRCAIAFGLSRKPQRTEISSSVFFVGLSILIYVFPLPTAMFRFRWGLARTLALPVTILCVRFPLLAGEGEAPDEPHHELNI